MNIILEKLKKIASSFDSPLRKLSDHVATFKAKLKSLNFTMYDVDLNQTSQLHAISFQLHTTIDEMKGKISTWLQDNQSNNQVRKIFILFSEL